ncbi:MAG: NADH-quinone oxidoreductase subunit L [Candidatus Melainabacteria bacterium]|nr:NADH-quinone oxidoreductase subunit L [Candidatus Melainabacteria bacterium]
MEQSIDYWRQVIELSPWIVAVPFLVGFGIIVLNTLVGSSTKLVKTLSMVASIGGVVYGFIHSLMIFYALCKFPELGPWVKNVPYFTSASFTLTLGVLVDNLCAFMLIVVTSVSLLVQVYTHGYMREDPGYSRFYCYLSLFTASMLGLVVATNLFQMYFFWELVGVCSYFLIGFWWYKKSAAEACLKAFVINRIGDFGFLVGVLWFFAVTYNIWAGHPVLQFYDKGGFDIAGAIEKAYIAKQLDVQTLAFISMVMFMGPMAKSAQFLLHTWLPDAMEGPTPISALIHAATMVAAGVYLVARAYPIWQSPDGSPGGLGLGFVAFIGACTAFMAATIAMSQYDIKRVLAWSTVSQLGYMFVGLGAGAFTGGLFHLFNHAFFKAMLFLCSGAVIHGLAGEQDIRKMGGLKKSMPWTAGCFLIGTLSISGCPGLSGFFSKDEIIASATAMDPLLGVVMILTAGLTAFYMFRVYFMTFEGSYRGNAHPHESPPVMIAPLVVLAIPSIFSGYLGFNFSSLSSISFSGEHGKAFANAFGSFIYFKQPVFEGINGVVMLSSIGLAAAGFIIAYMMYVAGSIKWNQAIAESKSGFVQGLYQFSFNKWYFDNLYMGILQKGILPAFQTMWKLVDMLIVDNIVNGAGMLARGTGESLRYAQNGRGQYYALVIFGWVAGLTVLVFFLR